MNIYVLLQCFKDILAIPIFIWLALSPSIYEHRPLLSFLFSIGGFIDAIYVSYTIYSKIQWTISSLKDALGAFGMLGFSIIIIFAPVSDCPSDWDKFFAFAAFIDILSIISLITPWNIYEWRLNSI